MFVAFEKGSVQDLFAGWTMHVLRRVWGMNLELWNGGVNMFHPGSMSRYYLQQRLSGYHRRYIQIIKNFLTVLT